MLVESFHNKLKTNPRYLDHQVNRRCDDLIQVLMKIEEDYFYERMRKEVIMKPEDASIKQEGHERHSKGENIDEASIKLMQVNILHRCRNTSEQDDFRLYLPCSSTSTVIELDSDTSDTASTDEELVTTQQQQPDGVASNKQ